MFGWVLWEGVTLVFVVASGLALLALRRKVGGRPAFTHQDWLTYFGDLPAQASKPRLVLKLSGAAFLCFLVVLIGGPLLVNLGAGLYSATFLFTSLGIVKLALS